MGWFSSDKEKVVPYLISVTLGDPISYFEGVDDMMLFVYEDCVVLDRSQQSRIMGKLPQMIRVFPYDKITSVTVNVGGEIKNPFIAIHSYDNKDMGSFTQIGDFREVPINVFMLNEADVERFAPTLQFILNRVLNRPIDMNDYKY